MACPWGYQATTFLQLPQTCVKPVLNLCCFCISDFDESDDEDEFKENNFEGNENTDKKKKEKSKTGLFIFR